MKNVLITAAALTSSPAHGRRNLVIGTVAETVRSAGVVGLVCAFGSYDPS